jgi:hypothetical protein
MKPAALQLLQQRAAAAGLSNVAVFEGMIEQYTQPFDVALALHACGNATDHVLQMAVQRGAAFVVSPCCVGEQESKSRSGISCSSCIIIMCVHLTVLCMMMVAFPGVQNTQMPYTVPDEGQRIGNISCSDS